MYVCMFVSSWDLICTWVVFLVTMFAYIFVFTIFVYLFCYIFFKVIFGHLGAFSVLHNNTDVHFPSASKCLEPGGGGGGADEEPTPLGLHCWLVEKVRDTTLGELDSRPDVGAQMYRQRYIQILGSVPTLRDLFREGFRFSSRSQYHIGKCRVFSSYIQMLLAILRLLEEIVLSGMASTCLFI